MKGILYKMILFTFLGCRQENSDQIMEQKTPIAVNNFQESPKKEYDLPRDRIEYLQQTLENEFQKVTLFKLTDTLSADFNGDGKLDKAIFKKENETSGIIINHGGTNEIVSIGFGKPFAHLTEFNWVDFWGIVDDPETFEIVIEDSEIIGGRPIELRHPAILLRKEDVGGGLITFKNSKYQWIHQAD